MAHAENLTIMFTDMVGYTERTARQSRAQNKAMLRQHDQLLLPLVARFGGRRVKSIGDALLITFRSPTDAVRCGMALVDALAEFNSGRPEAEQIHIRVAINAGEVRVEGRDVFGEAVNVAARVENVTPQDSIYFTESVYLAMNKAEVSSEAVGVQQLRGVPEPVRLFRVPPHQVSRLVPAGAPDAANGELPYGGMHRLPPDAGSRLRGWMPAWPARGGLLGRQLGPLVVAGLMAVVAGLWLTLPATPGPAAEPSSLAAVAAPQAAPDHGAQVRALLDQAEADFTAGRRPESMIALGQALDLDPTLRDDPRVAARLAAGLSWSSEQAMPIIQRHWSPTLAAALAQRATEPGRMGRQRAQALLRERNEGKRIDQGLVAIADLREAQNCDEKSQAATRLGRLHDRRALPALRDALGSGVGDWFRNWCHRDEVSAAIEAIEKG